MIVLDELLEAALSALVCGPGSGRAAWLSVAALAVSPCSRNHLLLRVLFSCLSDSRAAWSGRIAACGHVPQTNRRGTRPLALLVCAYASLVQHQRSRAYGAVLDRHDRRNPAGAESLDTRSAHDLLRNVLVVRRRRAGIRRLSVGRHAPCCGIRELLFRSLRVTSRLGGAISAVAREPVVASPSLVFDLFRIRRRQIFRWRSLLARPDRHGSVLSKRPTAHLDRLVCAAASAQIPCRHRVPYLVRGVVARLAGLPAPPLPHSLLLRGHLSPGRHHPHGELRVPQLPGPLARLFAARRSLPGEIPSSTMGRGSPRECGKITGAIEQRNTGGTRSSFSFGRGSSRGGEDSDSARNGKSPHAQRGLPVPRLSLRRRP